MNKKSILLICFILILFCSSVSGVDNQGKFVIGINYPGISLRYFKNDWTAWEVKLQSETNILVAGIRYYKYSNIHGNDRIQLIKGLEVDMVSFKGDTTEGYGLATEVFIGGEYSISKKLSLQLDFGPALIFLSDKNYTQVTALNLEFVLNMGVNFYLGGKSQ